MAYYPEINYISLLETTIKQKIGGIGFNPAKATLSSKKVKIIFFDENNRPTTIYIANNRIEAKEISENINLYYKVRIIDNFH